MKAVVQLRKGSPTSSDVLLEKDDVPIPTLRKGEILIKVAAEAEQVKPVIVPRSFELTTESLHAMMETSMSHRSKGKLVMKINKQ